MITRRAEGWITNIAKGAKAEPVVGPLRSKLESLALAASQQSAPISRVSILSRRLMEGCLFSRSTACRPGRACNPLFPCRSPIASPMLSLHGSRPARMRGRRRDTRRANKSRRAYIDACYQEIEALKPGNVHRFADGHRMNAEQFFESAQDSSHAVTDPALSTGQRILAAVTRRKPQGRNQHQSRYPAFMCSLGQSCREWWAICRPSCRNRST